MPSPNSSDSNNNKPRAELNERGASQHGYTDLDTQRLPQEESDQLMIMFLALESSGNGLLITDPKVFDNPIVYANQIFVQRCGFGLEQILGENCRFLQQGDRRQDSIKEVRDAIEQERPIETVFRNYRKDGSLYFTEISIAPMHDSRGKINNYVGVQYDLSARRKAEQRVSECYSVLSHELRTPITSVAAAVDLLKDGTGGRIPARAKKLLRRAEENCNKLTHLLDEILDWKKDATAHLRVNKTVCRLSDLLAAAKIELAPLAQFGKVKLTIEAPEDLDLIIDKGQLNKIIISLATNVIRWAPADTVVAIKVQRLSENITRFSVIGANANRTSQSPESGYGDTMAGSHTHGNKIDLAVTRALLDFQDSSLSSSQSESDQTCYWFDITDDKKY